MRKLATTISKHKATSISFFDVPFVRASERKRSDERVKESEKISFLSHLCAFRQMYWLCKVRAQLVETSLNKHN